MYKLLVLDLDDTLLNSSGQLSSENKKAIMKAQAKGVKVVLASGRPTGAMTALSKELKLDQYGSYMISFNGGEIVCCKTDKKLFEKSLTKNEIRELYNFSRRHNVNIITYKDGDIVSEDQCQYIDVEKDLTKMNFKKVDCFHSEVNYSATKCIMLEEPKYLKEVAEILKNEFINQSVSISKPFFLEVTADGIDKGKTLEKLCSIEGVKQDEVIAIGNAENDLSMIEYAGLGIWVDNTCNSLKSLGNAVTKSHDEHGVAVAIEKYILAS